MKGGRACGRKFARLACPEELAGWTPSIRLGELNASLLIRHTQQAQRAMNPLCLPAAEENPGTLILEVFVLFHIIDLETA